MQLHLLDIVFFVQYVNLGGHCFKDVQFVFRFFSEHRESFPRATRFGWATTTNRSNDIWAGFVVWSRLVLSRLVLSCLVSSPSSYMTSMLHDLAQRKVCKYT